MRLYARGPETTAHRYASARAHVCRPRSPRCRCGLDRRSQFPRRARGDAEVLGTGVACRHKDPFRRHEGSSADRVLPVPRVAKIRGWLGFSNAVPGRTKSKLTPRRTLPSKVTCRHSKISDGSLRRRLYSCASRRHFPDDGRIAFGGYPSHPSIALSQRTRTEWCSFHHHPGQPVDACCADTRNGGRPRA